MAALADMSDPALERGLENLMRLKAADGSFVGEYAGTLFLIPFYIATHHMLGEPVPEELRRGFIDYLTSQQQDDGGWGMDIESRSYVVSTVTNYVGLRLLGVPADDPRLVRARAFFLPRGGGLAASSWGKFLLTILGVYDYAGLNPLQPELWLLPESLPLHPSHYWVHCRIVYLPMSYMYGKRWTTPLTQTLREIRTEIYDQPYESIDWEKARHRIAPDDVYVKHAKALKLGFDALMVYEKRPSKRLREKALKFVLEHINAEDEASDFICAGPLNTLLNAIVCHIEEPGGWRVKRHLEQMPRYLWKAADGIKVKSYESSAIWDTAFAVQAISEANASERYREQLEGAQAFLADEQIIDEFPNREKFYREKRRGGWSFGSRAQGWPVSDCTGEALKALALMEPLGLSAKTVPLDLVRDAIDLILSLQNADGGFATYEPTRGPKWLELFNPSDFFAEIMIDYSYVECTSSSMQALALMRHRLPDRAQAIDKALARGVQYLRDTQRDDGSWEGFWGVCFTYGTWFAIEGLRVAGVDVDDPAIVKAAEFFKSKQRADGGWSETVEACRQRKYVEGPTSLTVQSAWAVLGLVAAGLAESDAVRRGCDYLRSKQLEDGSWAKENIAGITNRNCAIDYVSYWSIFPVWALGAAAKHHTL